MHPRSNMKTLAATAGIGRLEQPFGGEFDLTKTFAYVPPLLEVGVGVNVQSTPFLKSPMSSLKSSEIRSMYSLSQATFHSQTSM